MMISRIKRAIWMWRFKRSCRQMGVALENFASVSEAAAETMWRFNHDVNAALRAIEQSQTDSQP